MPLSVSALLRRAREKQQNLAVVSLHDAPAARIACDAGADLLLVGDSAGNTLLGYDDTLSVTMDEMAMLCAAVVRGVKKSSRADVPVIADLPFASYSSPRDAVRHGAVLMRTGASAVKIEGSGKSVLRVARALRENGIPVVGHIGYTPQFARGFDRVVQARHSREALELLNAAQLLNENGVAALVLEAVAEEATREITSLGTPTIGIGAGPDCDAQVLVWHDIVGISAGAPFRFVKRYGEAGAAMQSAVAGFVGEVQGGVFPTQSHGWLMNDGEAEALRVALNDEALNKGSA
jgi:3-methyl-2-oxobutanoate hydroxymethyltransferase